MICRQRVTERLRASERDLGPSSELGWWFHLNFTAATHPLLISIALGLLFLPPMWLVYRSYRLYMDRIRQNTHHIEELNRLNQAIIALP